VVEVLRPRPPPSGIESYESRGSAGGDRGDVGRPAIAFAKFYCQGILITDRPRLAALLFLDALGSRNFTVSLQFVYALDATDIVGSKESVPSRIRSVRLGEAL
jgi:hypothetical protein